MMLSSVRKRLLLEVFLAVCLGGLLIFPFFLEKIGIKTVQLAFDIQAPGCNFIEVFSNDQSSSRVSVPGSDYSTIVSDYRLPQTFWRLDPCDQKQVVRLRSIQLIQGDKVTQFPEEWFSSLQCVNCTLERSEGELVVTALNNDPIIFSTAPFPINVKIPFPLSSRKLKILTVASRIAIMGIVAGIAFWQTRKRYKVWLFGALTVFIPLVPIIYLHMDKVSLWLQKVGPDAIESQKAIGYSIYFGLSGKMENIIFSFLALFPVIFFVFVYAWKWRKGQ